MRITKELREQAAEILSACASNIPTVGTRDAELNFGMIKYFTDDGNDAGDLARLCYYSDDVPIHGVYSENRAWSYGTAEALIRTGWRPR